MKDFGPPNRTRRVSINEISVPIVLKEPMKTLKEVVQEHPDHMVTKMVSEFDPNLETVYCWNCRRDLGRIYYGEFHEENRD